VREEFDDDGDDEDDDGDDEDDDGDEDRHVANGAGGRYQRVIAGRGASQA
jgi:hypothetical protein